MSEQKKTEAYPRRKHVSRSLCFGDTYRILIAVMLLDAAAATVLAGFL